MALRFACPFIDPRGDDGRHRDIIVRDLNGRIVGRNDFVAEDTEIYVASYVGGDRGYVVLRGNEAIAYDHDGVFITIEEDPETGEAVARAFIGEGDEDGEEGEEGGGETGGAVSGAIDEPLLLKEDGEEGGGGGGADGAVAGEIDRPEPLTPKEMEMEKKEEEKTGEERRSRECGDFLGAGSRVLGDIFGIEDEVSGDGGEANILDRGAEATERVLEEVKRFMFLYI